MAQTGHLGDIESFNCWILGDERERVFPVEIPGSKTVGALKEAIKKVNQYGFPAKLLDLWKVSSVRLLTPDI